MNSHKMVGALVKAITNTNDLESTKGAVGTLHNLSMHKQGLLAIIKSGEQVDHLGWPGTHGAGEDHEEL